MNSIDAPTVVIVPGLRDHVPDHWQSLLADTLDNVRTVPPLERNKLDLAARIAMLETVVAESSPVVLVAHSAGVIITAHWAQHHPRQVRGALLATPPDLEAPTPDGQITMEELRRHGWIPTPRAPLPFPSIVAASTNDPLARFDRVSALANSWGSRLVDLGAVGHLNPASGYGRWPRSEELVRELCAPTRQS
ncbi:alpha/beta hydrolase [Streptomyces sp. NBC_00144]|uniref:RBBP9/YdeN family alpha/beta hydrolase n=1 Tax=Streptomyces sp. NBC_00144 TaxID=2975665 RepID=UPI003250A7FB